MNFCLNYFLLLVLIQSKLNEVETEDNNFNFVSTTQYPSYLSRQDGDPIDIRRSLAETKHRLEAFELNFIRMQEVFARLVELHGVTWEKIYPKKILRTFNSSLPEKSYDVNAEKLQQLKREMLEEVKKGQKEQTDIINGNLLSMKREIISEIGNVKNEILNCKSQSNNSQLLDEVKQILDEFEQKIVSKILDNNQPKQGNSKLRKTFKGFIKQDKSLEMHAIQTNPVSPPFNVLYNMNVRGGEWIYVLNRFDGSQDFSLNWTDYKQGFGSLEGEFWLGLERLHELTDPHGSELLLELTDWQGKTVYAYFKNFSVGSESEDYAIKVLEGYGGDVCGSFIRHLGSKFSTLDHIDEKNGYCVKSYGDGPWWYRTGCFNVKLTGKYGNGTNRVFRYGEGIHCDDFHGYRYSLKEAKMMIRPYTRNI